MTTEVLLFNVIADNKTSPITHPKAESNEPNNKAEVAEMTTPTATAHHLLVRFSLEDIQKIMES